MAMNGNGTSLLEPAFETIGIDPSHSWQLPLEVNKTATKEINSVWYLALPISSAHRRGNWEEERIYGNVYPHSALVLDRGQVSFHSCLMFHASSEITSDRPRQNLIVHLRCCGRGSPEEEFF